jgi:hypothetical protein
LTFESPIRSATASPRGYVPDHTLIARWCPFAVLLTGVAVRPRIVPSLLA